MPQIQITIVPKQIGEIWDQLLQDILVDVTRSAVHYDKKPLKELIPSFYFPALNVYQGECYMQYSSNLCGYHATFNALCCLHMYLNIQSSYNISSSASFWRFKKKVEGFLLQIKKANKLEDKWPWREKDILNGDFQRTYNKICVEMFDDFAIFQHNHKDFTYMAMTWEFQYKNILLSEQNKQDMNRKIKTFNEYQGSKPLIFGIMMGITCHWTYLVAFKSNGKTQYWFFDSHNEKQLEYMPKEIQESIQRFNQEQIKKKEKALTPFEREKYATLIEDTQISVKLLVGCLQGKDSIDKYSYNQLLNIFAKAIEAALETKDNNIVLMVVKDYWYNIGGFFKVEIKWDMLDSQSIERIRLLFRIGEELKNQVPEGQNLYNLLKRHTLPKGFS